MTTAKTFDLGDILSVTTGRLVSRDHMGGVYRILNHMTGDDLFTHQLPRAMDECRPHLLAQHPDLEDVVPPDTIDSVEACAAWLDSIAAEYGTEREVAPVPVEDHTRIDPLAEMRMLRPDAKVIVVETDR